MLIRLFAFLEYSLFPIFRFFFKKRFRFELKNLSEPGAFSFRDQSQQADLAIEFSSEGEFQQVKLLILELLKRSDYKIELIFSSESVEKEVVQLYQKYPHQLRYLRLPYFLRGDCYPSKWLTARKLLLVRYDFFPHLFEYGKHCEIFGLLSFSAKRLKSKNQLVQWLNIFLLKKFSLIICSSENDATWLEQRNISPKFFSVGEFRVNLIASRQQLKDETIPKRFPAFLAFETKLENFARNQRVIWGNFWEDEMPNIFQQEFIQELQDHQKFLTIVPHRLGKMTFDEVQTRFQKVGLQCHYVDEMTVTLPEGNIFYIDIKGILCELYSYFGVSYVGGGFRSSVHSLLEPFLANCMVYCGPKVYRSSEYDFILNTRPAQVQILQLNGKSSLKAVQENKGLHFLAELKQRNEQSLSQLIGILSS